MPIQHIHKAVRHLRAKPEHTRRQIAFASSVVLTGVIAVGWFAAVASSGAFTLAANTTTDAAGAAVATGQSVSQTVGDAQNTFSQLLGSVGASNTQTNAPSIVSVSDASSSVPSTPAAQNNTDQGVIHY